MTSRSTYLLRLALGFVLLYSAAGAFVPAQPESGKQASAICFVVALAGLAVSVSVSDLARKESPAPTQAKTTTKPTGRGGA